MSFVKLIFRKECLEHSSRILVKYDKNSFKDVVDVLELQCYLRKERRYGDEVPKHVDKRNGFLNFCQNLFSSPYNIYFSHQYIL